MHLAFGIYEMADNSGAAVLAG